MAICSNIPKMDIRIKCPDSLIKPELLDDTWAIDEEFIYKNGEKIGVLVSIEGESTGVAPYSIYKIKFKRISTNKYLNGIEGLIMVYKE